jgi:hypothetical protein
MLFIRPLESILFCSVSTCGEIILIDFIAKQIEDYERKAIEVQSYREIEKQLEEVDLRIQIPILKFIPAPQRLPDYF